jgi:hypothetical protein
MADASARGQDLSVTTRPILGGRQSGSHLMLARSLSNGLKAVEIQRGPSSETNRLDADVLRKFALNQPANP